MSGESKAVVGDTTSTSTSSSASTSTSSPATASVKTSTAVPLLSPARGALLVWIIFYFTCSCGFWARFGIALCSYWAIARSNSQWGPQPTPKQLSRRASIITDLMLKGGFPPQYKIPDSVIHGILYFERLPQTADVWTRLGQVLFNDPTMERFRSVGEIVNGDAVWRPIDGASLDQSYHLVVEPPVSDEAGIVSLVERLLEQPLDHKQPLWRIHFVQNSGSGRSAVIPRLAHAIGDGISLVQLFMKMLSDKDGNPVSMPAFLRNAKSSTLSSPSSSSSSSSPSSGSTPTSTGESKRAKVSPLVAIQTAIIGTLKAAVKVATLPVNPPDSVSAIRDLRKPWKWNPKSVFLAPPIPLTRIKSIKDALGATVNDVLVAALAGGIRRYLEFRNMRDSAPLDKINVRALIPYAFPRTLRHADDTALRNQWCFVSLNLPVEVGPMDAVKRLQASKQRCDQLKSTPEALIQYGAQCALGLVLPFSQQAATAFDLMGKHSVVFTNVPGPDQTVYFAGQPMLDMHAMVTNIIPQVTVLSYNGHVSLSVVLDETICSDGRRLTEFIMEELEVLQFAADRLRQ